MIEIKEKSQCCGCTACSSICPKKAIVMKQDEEGFMYPIIDKRKCVNCGLCDKVCPIKNVKENKNSQHAYIFQNADDKIRRESTSGGAFTAIAEYVIDNNGIVYGAVFDDKYKVIHKGIDNKEELYKFRNSKYVQSEMKNCYSEIKEYLNKAKLVCFSGTSCQVEGLKNYLGKHYENLILVDVVCRAVPSPLIWKKYLNMRQKQYKDISKIMFRDKYYGYKYSNLSIYSKNSDKKQEYHKGVDSDPYLRAFFTNICDRPSCYDCKFKKLHRESDITIWDCFNVEKFDKNFDDDKGTSRVLTHTENGKNIIDILSQKNKVAEIDVEKATNGFLAMFQPVKKNDKREQFFKDANQLSEEELFNKYFADTIKVKIERYGRLALLKTGMYKPILNIGKKIRKRD